MQDLGNKMIMPLLHISYLSQGRHWEVADTPAAGRLSEDGDLVRVPPEVSDIVPDPGEGRHHVLQALVTLDLLTVQTQPAQTAQAVVDCNLTQYEKSSWDIKHTEYDSLLTYKDNAVGVHELLRSIILGGAAASSEAPAMDPDHHRKILDLVRLDWGVQVKIETVFLTC